MNNFEKIKAMNIDDMASFIVKTHDYAGIMDQACNHCPHKVAEEFTCNSDNLECDCTKAIRILLEQEVSDATCENESPVE